MDAFGVTRQRMRISGIPLECFNSSLVELEAVFLLLLLMFVFLKFLLLARSTLTFAVLLSYTDDRLGYLLARPTFLGARARAKSREPSRGPPFPPCHPSPATRCGFPLLSRLGIGTQSSGGIAGAHWDVCEGGGDGGGGGGWGSVQDRGTYTATTSEPM